MIATEKRIAEQEQYFRQETVKLVGFLDNTNDGELEDAVIRTFEEAEVKVAKRSFHAIHRLWWKLDETPWMKPTLTQWWCLFN